MTQADKFKEIADAIRVKTGGSDNIIANNFAAEIMSIDRLKPMTLFPTGLNNGYYGNRAAQVAVTYHLARALGQETFTYDQSGGVFSNSSSLTKTIRDEDGLARIDCSTFVGLVLRGIPYENSPFATHKGAKATWNPSEELADMYGDGVWVHKWLDKQPEGIYSNLGISGYSSIRNAADLGEYFYKYGYVIFDARVDGSPTASLKDKLRPGDLLFWSKPSATDTQKKRFRSISHVAIVSENYSHYFEVTTGNSVVLYQKFEEKYENISLICRPKYRNYMAAEETPIGENLINYPWVYGAVKESTYGGITFTTVNKNTIHISGTNTSEINRKLKGNSETGMGFKLSAGTYELSGMDNVGIKSVGVALQVKNVDGTDFDTPVRCYTSNNPTFTISKDTDVIVVLHFGDKEYTVDCDITPTLTRIE